MNNLVITYSRKRRARKKKLEQVPVEVEPSKRVCQFCLSDEDCEVNFGTIFEKEDVVVHYFCMLLASGLCQNTKVSDKKSIFGFTVSDIKKEISRGSRLKCCFCHQRGATIGCCVKACRKVFHLSCGREHGTMHQFFDSFRSYCENHRLEQILPKKKPRQWNPAKTCSICFCAVTSFASCDTLIPPCCQKSLFHRQCMQQYSLSAGMHYFKCPLCNSIEEFQLEMRMYGIYIPDQDASWEREPNAFEELLERHNRCDVSECTCPQGRQFDADSGKYALLLCGWCGAYGSHKTCKGLVWRGIHLVCFDCAEIIDQAEIKQKQEENEREKLALLRPGSRKCAFLQKQLDEQLPTCSAARRLKESPREQSWSQNKNKNSPAAARKRQRMNSLQFQSPASLQIENDNRCSVQKRSTLFPDSSWRWAAENNTSRQHRGRAKCSKVATFYISNYVEWDPHFFDSRVVLEKADREINNILEKQHAKQFLLKTHSEVGKLGGNYTSMKPWTGKKPSCKNNLTDVFESCSERCAGNIDQTLVCEQMKNRSTVNDTSTAQANSSSEGSLPDLTDMHDFSTCTHDLSEPSGGIFSDRSPPVIQPGICWEVSPQKHKQKRSYAVTVSVLNTDSVDEILVGETVYTGVYTNLTFADQMSSTADDLQQVKIMDSYAYASPTSAGGFLSASECATNELTRTPKSVCNDTTIIALKFRIHKLCETFAEDKTDIPETVRQDSNCFLHSSAVLDSPPLLPRIENHNVDCNQDKDMGIRSADKGIMTYLDKMLTQTDIFGKVVMLDSTHKRRRMSKSKDSTAFLRLSQSKIENFLMTK